MGACISSPTTPEVSERDAALHREAERRLKEAKAKLAKQVKVLLLGSGDSGKSTILKQMRLIHRIPFTTSEVEHYRQLIFENLTRGLRSLLDAMVEMGLPVSPEIMVYVDMIDDSPDVGDGEPFPPEYETALRTLWDDENVRKGWNRGNEAALPENLPYFFQSLPRLFAPGFTPTAQDIIRTRARTIGITETTFQLNDHEMLMVDVGGQKSERRKWIHCFQDVTSILFLISLSGYDQCLVEDKDSNQMQDAMTIWDAICHSQWFKRTSIILFLNKFDLFERKLPSSDIRNYFPDYEGDPGDVKAGLEYFMRRFSRLAQKAGKSRDREIYMHVTTATDTDNLRVIMAAVQDTILTNNIKRIML